MFDWLTNLFDKRKTVYTPVNPEDIRTNEVIQAQQRKIMSLESQLSKKSAEESRKRDSEKGRSKEKEIYKKLDEQKKDIQANKYGKTFSLGMFYSQLLNNKSFREKLEIFDKNGEVSLGKFGDFVFLEGGKLAIIDSEYKVLAYGNKISQVIYKPDGFGNQVKRGMICIPMDKDGNWIEDLDYVEVEEPMESEFDEETGKVKWIKWSTVKRTELKKLIANYLERINMLTGEIERQETTLNGLKQEIADKNRSMKTYKVHSESSTTELSKALERYNSANIRLGDMNAQIVKLSEMKAMYESLLEKKDNIIEQVIAKLEVTGNPKYDVLTERIKRDLEFYKAILPETVENILPAPAPELVTTQPGEVIKR